MRAKHDAAAVIAVLLAIAAFWKMPAGRAVEPQEPRFRLEKSALSPTVAAASEHLAARANEKRPTPVAPEASGSPAACDGWRTARASWYGPGFYGNTMAGGGKLTPTSMVVAHRTLPFGTKVEIEYKGRRVIAVVQDRGPFVRGRTFDLGPGTAKALGFSGVGTIRWRLVR